MDQNNLSTFRHNAEIFSVIWNIAAAERTTVFNYGDWCPQIMGYARIDFSSFVH
jgi:hypothetical protein